MIVHMSFKMTIVNLNDFFMLTFDSVYITNLSISHAEKFPTTQNMVDKLL